MSNIHFTQTVDPNRPGMHMKLIKFLLRLQAARIVYVSCNPATCARDLDYLCHPVVCSLDFLMIHIVLNDFCALEVYSSYSQSCCDSNSGRAKYKGLLQAEKSAAS